MRATILVLILVAGLMAGCGGDDAETVATTTTAAPAPGPIPTTAPGDTGAPATTAAPGDDDDGEVSPLNCPELFSALSGAANAVGGAMGGAALPGAEFAIDLMQELSRRGPEEIRDDFATLATGYQAFIDELTRLGIDLTDPNTILGMDEATIEELNTAAEALETATDAAADNINAFVDRECS